MWLRNLFKYSFECIKFMINLKIDKNTPFISKGLYAYSEILGRCLCLEELKSVKKGEKITFFKLNFFKKKKIIKSEIY